MQKNKTKTSLNRLTKSNVNKIKSLLALQYRIKEQYVDINTKSIEKKGGGIVCKPINGIKITFWQNSYEFWSV